MNIVLACLILALTVASVISAMIVGNTCRERFTNIQPSKQIESKHSTIVLLCLVLQVGLTVWLAAL